MIVPQLLRLLRPYYRREIIRSLLTEEDMNNGEELELETSDHLHVHLAFVACVISAVAFLGAAVSTTTRALIFCKSSLTSLVRLLTGVTQAGFGLDLSRSMVLRPAA